MATIQEIISKFVADGTISPADAVRVSEHYGRLLERNGDPKSARLELIAWLEQEAARRRAAYNAAAAAQPRATVAPAPAPGPSNTILSTVLSAIGRGWATGLGSLVIGAMYYFALRKSGRIEWFETAGAPAFVAFIFWLQTILRAAFNKVQISETRVLLVLLEKMLIAYGAFGLGLGFAYLFQMVPK